MFLFLAHRPSFSFQLPGCHLLEIGALLLFPVAA